jgi:cytoskeletal protein RodZ
MNHNVLKKILYILLVVLLLLAVYLIVNFQPSNNETRNNDVNVEIDNQNNKENSRKEDKRIILNKTENYLENADEGEDITMVKRDLAIQQNEEGNIESETNAESTDEGAVVEGLTLVENSGPKNRENPNPFPELIRDDIEFMNEEDMKRLGIDAAYDVYFQILSWNEDGTINAYKPVRSMEDIVYPE